MGAYYCGQSLFAIAIVGATGGRQRNDHGRGEVRPAVASEMIMDEGRCDPAVVSDMIMDERRCAPVAPTTITTCWYQQ